MIFGADVIDLRKFITYAIVILLSNCQPDSNQQSSVGLFGRF